MRSAVLFDCIDLKGDGMITPTEAKRVFQQAHATSGSEFECLHLVSAACWMMTWFQSVSERESVCVLLFFCLFESSVWRIFMCTYVRIDVLRVCDGFVRIWLRVHTPPSSVVPTQTPGPLTGSGCR